jgi:hypothetical protein
MTTLPPGGASLRALDKLGAYRRGRKYCKVHGNLGDIVIEALLPACVTCPGVARQLEVGPNALLPSTVDVPTWTIVLDGGDP